ncbi:MAG TPA: protein translocase subunit SecD [Tepidisphaeraceae bacterium]|jgi:SecD/SecF fusion protein|nr:protein translocase subunit SecD [Tepidisphaeraceae bacterium]
MPTTYTSRVTLILVVLLAALWMIFPSPLKLLNPNIPFSEKNALKPGIDMVGGTSLLYEIKEPDGGYHGQAGHTLAEDVMDSLKKRVDPDGVRNLIWRPQGHNRLEIQMPLTGKNNNAREKREAFDAAQQKLNATNVRLAQVTDAVENLTGDARRDRINQLAMGSKRRAELFGAMASVWDQIQQARAAKNSSVQADKEDEYDSLKSQVEETNLDPTFLSQKLDAVVTDKAKYQAAADQAKAQFPDFSQRNAAIDDFVNTYKDYVAVKGSLDDAGDLKRLLKGSGVLEFHILVEDKTSPEVLALRERLPKSGPRPAAGDTMKWVEVDNPDEFVRDSRVITGVYNNKLYVLVYAQPGQQLVNGEGIAHWALERAYPASGQYGEQVVGFEFDPQGAKYFSELTRLNKDHPLGIVLDDKLISAPNINQQIGKSGVIEGGSKGFSQKELDYLIGTLNAGSLPAQLADEPISEQTVGPQLGADNLRAGLRSCLFGLIVVGVFLIFYYYISGAVAFFAVIMNLVMILGVMAMLNATFTLPGVAGVVLTIGAAVDANVLIFERFREEQQRGLSLRMALRNAYDRAFSAIVDSNMTTVITSLVLCWIGSEEVKGFGITLLIGLVSSLFTALFVTKTIFGIMIDKFGVTNLSSFPLTFPAWDRFLKPNIDWMGKVKYFLLASVLFMIVGGWAFGHYANRREILDIEFASGTDVQFQLKQPMPIEDVRKMVSSIGDQAIPSPSVVEVRNAGQAADVNYEVITPNPNSAEVRDAIFNKFSSLLNIELPSQFDGDKLKLDDAMNVAVFPITADTKNIAGLIPPDLGSYRGGAAIALKNLSPKLSAKDIRERIGRMRLQAQAGNQQSTYSDFIVFTDADSAAPVDTAAILTVDPAIPFGTDLLKWKEEVANPMWKLVAQAVTNQAQLQKVNTFDPSIAADTARDAIMALTVSLIIIMVYIWLRFGNLQFGTATVLAMIHDTFLAIAAIGLAHLAYQYVPPLANALLLEPFRLNLTLVAAILTIMSYSMIDTIVVFDRIRENRGKFGHLDRQVINDSINQTLSRTLLTAGTTIVTVAVMYVAGGPGIHGFTFVLLFGILVGTYSSIAIAAPILLFRRTTPNGGQPGAVAKPVRQLQRA